MISRRDALLVAASGVAVAGCGRLATEARRRKPAPEYRAKPKDRSARIIDRMSFGWSVEEADRFASLGEKEYIERQLRAAFEEPLELTVQLQSLDCLRMNGFELIEIPRGRVTQQLQSAAILRASYSPNQLKERLVDFWSNHFNIYSGKADGAFFKSNEEELIIRKHAMGKFRDMAVAMSKSPAMLVYLDNNQNVKGHPNENYARELMELHTLGIDGGYTQKDIQELARCLTGWTMEDRSIWVSKALRARGSFYFDKSKHDDGAKHVFGLDIPAGGGIKDGERIVEHLVAHEETGKYLAKKLVKFFTGAQNAELQATVLEQFKKTGGDIPAMVRPILTSPALVDGPPIMRRPFELMCAALRVSGAATDGGPALQNHLKKMGQPLYEWPLPDGYPVDQLSWATNLLPRWQFVYDLANGKIPNTFVKAPDAVILARQLAHPDFQYA